MSSGATYALRTAFAAALLLCTIVQPALIRCVDASGAGSVELPGADCCPTGKSDHPSAHLAEPDCTDETLIAPAIKRSSDADALPQTLSTYFALSHIPFAAPVAACWPAVPTTGALGVVYVVPAIHLTAQLNC